MVLKEEGEFAKNNGEKRYSKKRNNPVLKYKGMAACGRFGGI